ncbi:MAG TPA: AAA family ATPase, partial [Gaiellaceae bacterium]|nr:AAA family ATPase [Gaiellaceae bacterium]
MAARPAQEQAAGPTIVGRERELAAVDEFLAVSSRAPAALVLEGEPGIGKTTLWQAAKARAVERGALVLASRAGSSEARLTFVGLSDLLSSLPGSVLEELPGPQRRALDIALLRAEADGPAPDRRAVSTAFLSVVQALARERPLVMAVDDVQWLDAPSLGVLEFTLRRLTDEPAAVVVTRRLTESGPGESFEAVLRERGARRLRVGPLTVAALHEIIKARLGRTFPRPTLVRIEQVSGGNPFFALEIARALEERGGQVSGPIPIPDDLSALLRRRLRRLPRETRDALLVAAALSQPTTRLVDADALAPAEAAGIVRIGAGSRIEFDHPLLAAAVYGAAPLARRRRMHASLAERLPDPEERARHLALASDEPDERVAAALSAAARSALARGAPDTAIELLELACERTPADPVEALHSRRLELGICLAEGGDPGRARALLCDLVDARPSEAIRVGASIALGVLIEAAEGGPAAAAYVERALEGVADPLLRARAHAAISRACDHDLGRKVSHARAALALLGRAAPSPALEAYVLHAVAEADFHAGRGVPEELLGRAASLEASGTQQPEERYFPHVHPGLLASERLLGILRLDADQLALARAQLERERRLAGEHGDELGVAKTLCRLATIELRAGRWDDAERLVTELMGVVERTAGNVESWALSVKTAVDAARGRLEAGLAAGTRGLALAEETGAVWQVAQNSAALGFLELSRDDLAAARVHLDRAEEVERGIGLGEPGIFRHHADRIEALIALGELAEAETALERLELLGEATGRTWALATGARCRGLLLAARGDLARAAAALE